MRRDERCAFGPGKKKATALEAIRNDAKDLVWECRLEMLFRSGRLGQASERCSGAPSSVRDARHCTELPVRNGIGLRHLNFGIKNKRSHRVAPDRSRLKVLLGTEQLKCGGDAARCGAPHDNNRRRLLIEAIDRTPHVARRTPDRPCTLSRAGESSSDMSMSRDASVSIRGETMV